VRGSTVLGKVRFRASTISPLAIAAAWLFSLTALNAQTCKLNSSNGMCAKPRAICSPIGNPDKSSAKKGNCTTKFGRHPTGNTCECLGKLDVPPPPPDHTWDLVQSNFGLDPNGFMRMPNWKWASPGPERGGLDVCDFCPCKVGTWGIDAPDHQESDWLAGQSCTHGPIHENSNNLCAGGPAQTFGHDASGVGYHMNWGPVEYEGPLQWEDHSTWLFPQSSGDNEYTFNILRPDLFLVTAHREERGIHLEFDSTETVDEWDETGTWWKFFHHDVVDHFGLGDQANRQIRDTLGTPWAVVIGMLGLDVAHTDHHAELHPVYAMFIRDPTPLGPPIGSPQEARWVFFVRNWGTEGSCGHNQEKLLVDHIDVQLPDTRLGSAINVRPYRHGQDHGACPQEWFIDPNGVLRFPMANPDMKCGWVGDITMVKSGFTPPFRVAIAQIGSEGEQEVSSQASRISKLNAAQRQELTKQLSDLLKVSPTLLADKVPVTRVTAPFPRAAQFKVTPTNVKAAPDPDWQKQQEQRKRLMEEFLKARAIQ